MARIRLSKLETDRVYSHSHPLLVLHPSGVKKMGEIHLAVRFTCSSLLNMMEMYSQPFLPKMHYIHPLTVAQLDSLRNHATQIVSMRLSRAEPPLRKEVVEFMLDMGSHMWSIRRSKANLFRIMGAMGGVIAVGKWFDEICNWKNPTTTVLIHILFVSLVFYPQLILPIIFLCLFLYGLLCYRWRPKNPPHMDTRISCADNALPDELDEEFDTFPTSRPADIIRMRYDRLRSISGLEFGTAVTRTELPGLSKFTSSPIAQLINSLVLFMVSLTFSLTLNSFQAGLVTAYILRGLYFGRHSSVREISLMVLVAYLSYMLAELFELSGILTVFFTGVLMSHYSWHNVTESSRITTRYAFAALSFIAETFIFLYVGMDALDYEKWKVSALSFGTRMEIYMHRSGGESSKISGPNKLSFFWTPICTSQGVVYDCLLELISDNMTPMRSNLYGRKILAWFEKRRILGI